MSAELPAPRQRRSAALASRQQGCTRRQSQPTEARSQFVDVTRVKSREKSPAPLAYSGLDVRGTRPRTWPPPMLECAVAWLAEDGYCIEPYGLDIIPELAARARQRLPHWADRMYVGNALEWTPDHRRQRGSAPQNGPPRRPPRILARHTRPLKREGHRVQSARMKWCASSRPF